MEPATGILNIPVEYYKKVKILYKLFILLICLKFIFLNKNSSSFINIVFLCSLQTCVICKQMHGACTQCWKCSTYYHTMCAARAGYHMEVDLHQFLINWACANLK
jgi:hypothetical protein